MEDLTKLQLTDKLVDSVDIINTNYDILMQGFAEVEEALEQAGKVETVNGIGPDENKNVTLTAADVGASPSDHNHSGVYAPSDHNHSGVYAPVSHSHSYAPSSAVYVSSKWNSGTSWYRVWSDGWIEQGGRVAPSSDSTANTTISFFKGFRNTSYTLQVVAVNTSGTGHYDYVSACINTVAASSATVGSYYSRLIHWYACGY